MLVTFSWTLIKIEVWFFSVYNHLMYEHILSVGLSPKLQNAKIFKIEVEVFFVKISLINCHLLYEYLVLMCAGYDTKHIN